MDMLSLPDRRVAKRLHLGNQHEFSSRIRRYGVERGLPSQERGNGVWSDHMGCLAVRLAALHNVFKTSDVLIIW